MLITFALSVLAGGLGGFGANYGYGKVNTDPQPVYIVQPIQPVTVRARDNSTIYQSVTPAASVRN